MNHIYVISGLGVDAEVFKHIDFGNFNPIFIDWIVPDVGESISAYAQRLCYQIHDDEPVLVGLSFGGMMAIEIAKLIPVSKVILLAPAKCHAELPFYFKWIGSMGLHHFVPTTWMKRNNWVVSFVFGATTVDEKKLLSAILKRTDARVMEWSVNCIVRWQNEVVPENVIHIHGSADRILPIRFVKPDIIINGGGHFMTVNKADEISAVIKNIVSVL